MTPLSPDEQHAVHLQGSDRAIVSDQDPSHYSQAAGSQNIPRLLADGSLSYYNTHPTPATVPENEVAPAVDQAGALSEDNPNEAATLGTTNRPLDDDVW